MPPDKNNIDISPAKEFEKPILRQLLELYQYDFSEFDGSDLGPLGVYDYPYLDHYWVESERAPYLVRVDGNLAGFVLIARHNYFTGLNDHWALFEFFILRKYRHQGIGEHVACFIFSRYQGSWQVAQITENMPATQFWRKVISRYTHGNFQEQTLDNEHWHGPVQTFTSPPQSQA
jgi:predicted acetyltransferase